MKNPEIFKNGMEGISNPEILEENMTNFETPLKKKTNSLNIGRKNDKSSLPANL